MGNIECPRCGRSLPVFEIVGASSFQTHWKLSPCPDCEWTADERKRALDAVFQEIPYRGQPIQVEVES